MNHDLGTPVASTDSYEQGGTGAEQGWFRRHLWPIVGLLSILATGMAFSFWWVQLIHHAPVWQTPDDLWSTFRDAHYVVWSGEGQVYSAHTNFVTFPGIAVLLAPVAEIQRVFNLSESYPVYLARPSAWYVLGPVDMICGGVMLFPLDAIAQRLRVSSRRRILLIFAESALIWPTVAMWGHPEDTLALAFAFGGLLAAFDRRWVHAGGLFALAVVFQPLVLLMFPIALAFIPVKKWPALFGIVALPSVALLIPPLVQEWGPTIHAIFKQPNFPSLNHPTPWMAFAPVLQKSGVGYVGQLHYVVSHGKHILEYGPVKVHHGEVVAAGPGRIIALVLACLVGVWVARSKPSLERVVWWTALALSLRCLFESVMDPYYLLPALALALVVAFRQNATRCSLAVVSAALCTWCSYFHHAGEWGYYLLVMGALLLTLGFAWPTTDTEIEPATYPRQSTSDREHAPVTLES
jgi:hypothetical protein